MAKSKDSRLSDAETKKLANLFIKGLEADPKKGEFERNARTNKTPPLASLKGKPLLKLPARMVAAAEKEAAKHRSKSEEVFDDVKRLLDTIE